MCTYVPEQMKEFVGKSCTTLLKIYEECRGQDSIPQMQLSSLKGRKVCGRRGGRSFKEVVRPSLSDG